MWTIAYRKPKANRFRRVTNWSGTWHQARELGDLFIKAHPELQVFYVPSKRAERSCVLADDIGNILVESGRRVRMTETGVLSAELLAQVPDATEAKMRWLEGAE